jgi:hypothetical protein
VALLPSWGMSNAVATLVGQNLGARKPERAERSVFMVGLYNMAFLLMVMFVFLAWGEPLIAVFTSDPEVKRLGALCLRIVSYGYAFYAWGMVLGAGVQRRRRHEDADLDQSRLLLVLPAADGVRARARPRSGSARGVPGDHDRGVVLAVVGLLVFRRGAWKRQEV